MTMKGKKHSDKSKKKMSISHSGHGTSEDTKKKLSQALIKAYTEGRKSKHKSLEQRKKISNTLKGNIPWNKGKKLSEEHKKKIGMAREGKKFPNLSRAMLGRKVSLATREKIGLGNKGKIESIETKKKKSIANTKEKNPAWKGGISQENLKCRQGYKYKTWVRQVLKRDNNSCKVCQRATDIVCHHLEGFDTNIKLRFEVSNGVSLCRDCHAKFHKKYGYGNNTKQQINEFIK